MDIILQITDFIPNKSNLIRRKRYIYNHWTVFCVNVCSKIVDIILDYWIILIVDIIPYRFFLSLNPNQDVILSTLRDYSMIAQI